MRLQPLILRYTRYNLWANRKLVSFIETHPLELSYQLVPSSYPSIDKTLQHMLRAQRFWLAFICGHDFRQLNWAAREGEALAIRQELLETSEQMVDAFSAFSEADLMTELNLDMPWAKNRQPRYEYILHCVNHSTFHRGQVVTMLRALGVTEGIPGTDYQFFTAEG